MTHPDGFSEFQHPSWQSIEVPDTADELLRIMGAECDPRLLLEEELDEAHRELRQQLDAIGLYSPQWPYAYHCYDTERGFVRLALDCPQDRSFGMGEESRIIINNFIAQGTDETSFEQYRVEVTDHHVYHDKRRIGSSYSFALVGRANSGSMPPEYGGPQLMVVDDELLVYEHSTVIPPFPSRTIFGPFAEQGDAALKSSIVRAKEVVKWLSFLNKENAEQGVDLSNMRMPVTPDSPN